MTKKKTKRPNISQETLERARAEIRGDQEVVETSPSGTLTTSAGAGTSMQGGTMPRSKPARATGVGAIRRAPSLEELKVEYRYVLRDLRNLAILAAILFVVIVAAAVVLPSLAG